MLVGCSSQASGEEPTISSLPLPTATVLSTLTPQPPETTPPPSPVSQPTTTPFDGITFTQVNVRAEPSTAGPVLGIIPPDMRVEIVGKDPGGNWWQILYPQGAQGTGWVTAQYIRTPVQPNVPVIGEVGPNSADQNLAVILQQLNVRSGPGTDFNAVGTLNAQDAVSLIGKDAHGSWLQIEFAAGPEGKGWVSAAFVQATGVEGLPIVTETGLILGTGTPTGVPPTSTPTLGPAREDNDSHASPIIYVFLEPAGTRISIYNGDVSAPQGDPEDWIQFTTYSQAVLLEITCEGGEPEIKILQDGQQIAQGEALRCGGQSILRVEPELPVTLHLTATSGRALTYISYTLSITALP
jgi:uncharacterized protein YraI